MTLCDSLEIAHFNAVARFVGADATGAFGIRPHHETLLVVLRYGLARFQLADESWRYLSLPGGVVHFSDNHLKLMTTRYFMGEEREKILRQLTDEMEKDHSEISNARSTLAEIEKALIRRFNALSIQLQGSAGR